VLASIVPVESSPAKPPSVTPPPLNLSKLSQKSSDRGIKKKKVRSKEQSQSQSQSRKGKKKGKKRRGQDELPHVNYDLYDRSLPESDPFYGGNSIDSFDLEYLSKNVHRKSAESKGRSGRRVSNDRNETAFSGIEEKASDYEVLYGGSPNLSGTIYKEEKESDVPAHFDLEYFTRMHDVSTSVNKKNDRWCGNSGESSAVGNITSSLRAASNSGAPSASSDSISPFSPGKGREVNKGAWAETLLTGNGRSHSSDLTGPFLPKNKSAAVRSFNI
jgi:hypothetical protein